MFHLILFSCAILSRKLSYTMLARFEQSSRGFSNNDVSIKNQPEENVKNKQKQTKTYMAAQLDIDMDNAFDSTWRDGPFCKKLLSMHCCPSMIGTTLYRLFSS